jgi:F-type H+-transporting ATPase subunit delta
MGSHRAASRYAKSLLELASEKKVLEEVHGDMQLFSAVASENRAFTVMLRNPIINHDKKRNILHAIFDSKMNKLSLSAFDLITKKNRENILIEIATEFQIQYNILKGYQEADLTTTIKLDDNLRKKFNDLVENISKKKPMLNEIVDDDIVGGFVLNVGDRRLDNSIKSQLAQLKRELTN